ncbi:MAG: hypothetical protein OEV64_11840 [Desulfobulbaceae bacterium]|nr:hypothetical protein [Desulfobulbaceae bacterium]
MAAPAKDIFSWIVVLQVIPAILLTPSVMARAEESALSRFEQELRKENKKESGEEDEDSSSHEECGVAPISPPMSISAWGNC